MHASGKSPTSARRHASVGVAIPVEMWLGKRPKLIGSGMSLQPPGSAGALAGPSPHSRHLHAAGTSPLPSTHFIPGTSGRQRYSRSGNSRVGHQVLAGQVRGSRPGTAQVRCGKRACKAAPGAVSDLTLGQFSITPKTLADGVAERCTRLTSLRAPHPPVPRWPGG